MKYSYNTIEDYLELIAGLHIVVPNFVVENQDSAIINSIAKQVFRGTALTDRQYDLMRLKILKYKSSLELCGYEDVEASINNLRKPIREIDRSKTIEIIDPPEMIPGIYEGYKKFIRIRFPFNKKTIAVLERVSTKHKKFYYHRQGTDSHIFVYNELTAYEIVKEFKDRNFEIDQEILEMAASVEEIMQQPEQFVPLLQNGKVINVKQTVVDQIDAECGDDHVKLVDRHRRYGLVNNDNVNITSLINNIVNRKEIEAVISPTLYKTNDVFEVIHYLERYPLLVVLNEAKAEEEINEVWNSIFSYIDNEHQSVLFRLEGTSNFNNFVKDKKLNNWVDKKTKIVYISKSKLPKLLVTGDWKPISAFCFSSGSMNRYVDAFVGSTCDLVINYDEQPSLMKRYSNYYSW